MASKPWVGVVGGLTVCHPSVICATKYQEAQHCLSHAGKLIGLFLIHDDYDGIDLRPRVPLITRLCD